MGRGYTDGGLRFTGRNGWLTLGIEKVKGGFQLLFGFKIGPSKKTTYVWT
jgi:hypothetical protein